MSQEANRADEVMKSAGGLALQQGVQHSVTAFSGSPALGHLAGGVAKMAPDGSKQGAALGGLFGAAAVVHTASLGTATALTVASTVAAPVILSAAVIGGLLGLIFGGGDSKK